jgi:copper(I)-binding protein
MDLDARIHSMKHDLRSAVLPAIAFGLAIASVTEPAEAVITINQPWLRPAQAAQATELYMDVTSSEGALIVGARTDAATAITLLAPGKKTIPAVNLTLPPQTMVALAPGHYRFGLSRLQRTLKRGDRVLLVLAVEMADGSRQEIPVDAEVRMHSPLDDEMRAHGHAHSSH